LARQRPLDVPAAFFNLLPTLDNLRNFFLTPTMEMLNFPQNLRAQRFETQGTRA